MNTALTVKEICDFLKREVADNILLKKPDNITQNENYTYTEVHPAVFPLYIPTSDKAGKTPVPCVGVYPTSITTKEDVTEMRLQFTHICWNVGTHSDGVWTPTGGLTDTYTRPKEHTATQTFDLYAESWADMLNFADLTRWAIIKMGNIHGLRLMTTKPIEQIIDTRDVTDSYGIWTTHIIATFEARPVVRKDISDMLY